ncbi:DUF3943 domain-containing protein [Echinimonas agarilytica]|uniref:DUF3943 domain-containing protein n=1 Tax=Echinimonas agarilytica TaxID=1215918 RepID=A0AA41W7X7_9GAMM|nr:DUF3943 domain-containing protein [Echinimonas agarilytica]MCM2680058.1 DUF3943 domain-containing protein [Echinimonas agarilytica]
MKFLTFLSICLLSLNVSALTPDSKGCPAHSVMCSGSASSMSGLYLEGANQTMPPQKFDGMETNEERRWSQTKLIFGLGFGVAGVLWAMPESVTNWEKDGDNTLVKRWWDNVSHGPVWDEDDWYINYIGHPYFGGVYYQVSRKSGYSPMESTYYAFLMSTFYWEYGLEAFAEIPSIQDLIVTPLGGALYGEWAYQTEKEIIANGGVALGSETWGSVSLFLLDPVDSIGESINRLMKDDIIHTGYMQFHQDSRFGDASMPPVEDDQFFGVQLTFVMQI